MVGKDIRAQVFHSIQVKVLATFLLILLPVYVLGAVIFHWTYLQMHQQIIRSQMALLNLYAETIDDEISRIRLLEYNCINDDDLGQHRTIHKRHFSEQQQPRKARITLLIDSREHTASSRQAGPVSQKQIC
ncbi:hypothetical protein FYJ76_16690 [Ruthenibacterium lactatiformans]|uniref:Uncharacterized protein n=1 Tax=Ruthenibacterium lactatiformans TaxID=1550024 RepID=A0A6I2UDN4_9FIRM|nr:hypothetical protein [Ruthenibacterium lactatiformans]MST93550.1 hypothetical protein [Ruthenibacterium lactatiformans]